MLRMLAVAPGDAVSTGSSLAVIDVGVRAGPEPETPTAPRAPEPEPEPQYQPEPPAAPERAAGELPGGATESAELASFSLPRFAAPASRNDRESVIRA
jgi:pyruvate/2-oxoglutarate dehydrogenase complex dihydrolipoamide acyltransferase (E2) component